MVNHQHLLQGNLSSVGVACAACTSISAPNPAMAGGMSVMTQRVSRDSKAAGEGATCPRAAGKVVGEAGRALPPTATNRASPSLRSRRALNFHRFSLLAAQLASGEPPGARSVHANRLSGGCHLCLEPRHSWKGGRRVLIDVPN